MRSEEPTREGDDSQACCSIQTYGNVAVHVMLSSSHVCGEYYLDDISMILSCKVIASYAERVVARSM